jgi:hypothetical protein
MRISKYDVLWAAPSVIALLLVLLLLSVFWRTSSVHEQQKHLCEQKYGPTARLLRDSRQSFALCVALRPDGTYAIMEIFTQ